MERFLAKQFSVAEAVEPILTLQTVSYAISLSVQSVCFLSSDELLKGKVASSYERAFSDLAS